MKKAVNETPAEVRRRLNKRLQTYSAELAILGLEEVVENKEAPAPARATAGTSLLRAAGYLERREAGEGEKQPHEMTPEELQTAIDSLRENADRMTDKETDNDDGVFD